MTEQDKLRLEAAEKLGYDLEIDEFVLSLMSDADLAEALRVKIISLPRSEKQKGIIKAGLYSHYLYGVANEQLDNPSEDEYLKWLEWDCTPLQKIEAASKALEE